MTLLVSEDLVVGEGYGFSGPERPSGLESAPLTRLRWNGSEIIDVADVPEWYVDAGGAKHLDAAPDRQLIVCAWDAALLRDGASWRVRTAADDLIAYAHAEQWRRVEAGLMVAVPGGPSVYFPTDTTGRGLINGAVTRAQQSNPPSGFRWQTGATTFVTLTPAQVIAAGVAVADYVQGTFDTLDEVITDILSGTITSTAQIDTAPWPDN